MQKKGRKEMSRLKNYLLKEAEDDSEQKQSSPFDDSLEVKDMTFKMRIGRHWYRYKEIKNNNPKELAAGMKVELEHVPNGTEPELAKWIACNIALDHIAENSKYYVYLEKDVESKNDGIEDNWSPEKANSGEKQYHNNEE